MIHLFCPITYSLLMRSTSCLLHLVVLLRVKRSYYSNQILDFSRFKVFYRVNPTFDGILDVPPLLLLLELSSLSLFSLIFLATRFEPMIPTTVHTKLSLQTSLHLQRIYQSVKQLSSFFCILPFTCLVSEHSIEGPQRNSIHCLFNF